MPGAPDPLYVLARSALLDALEALGHQRDAVILVGAQAIYLHTGEIEVARKARGLEAALIDKTPTLITALHHPDARSFSIAVAGPAALIVSKVHKIDERLNERQLTRLDDKDALDVLRLLQAVSTSGLAQALRALMRDTVAGEVTLQAVASLRTHFEDVRAAGPQMAARAAGLLADADAIAQSCAILTTDLLQAIGE
jgi:hypothetical protein